MRYVLRVLVNHPTFHSKTSGGTVSRSIDRSCRSVRQSVGRSSVGRSVGRWPHLALLPSDACDVAGGSSSDATCPYPAFPCPPLRPPLPPAGADRRCWAPVTRGSSSLTISPLIILTENCLGWHWRKHIRGAESGGGGGG